MNIYLTILKPLLKSTIYNKYYNYINVDSLKKDYPDIYRLYQALNTLHNSSNNDFTIDDLQVALYTNFPRIEDALYKPLFEELRESQVDETLLEGYLSKAAERGKAIQLSRLALQAADGEIDFAEVEQRFNSFKDTQPTLDSFKQDIVSSDLRKLYEATQLQHGLRWRLNSLNRALGSLRTGNFGFLFARPETGKTTFLASELTFMASQIPAGKGPAIWFNNEQAGNDVQERIFQAALGLERQQLYTNLDENQLRYNEVIGDKLLLLDNASYGKKDIEAICKEYNPSLIVFDQIDNLKGFTADRQDLEFKEIYQWARELGKQYGPTLGVCQAGATGEDKKWLTMNDVDSSKTSKQSTADWILGIGKVHEQGFEQVRFLHLSKNKLPGDADSDPKERHGKWQAIIRPEIARYSDI